MSPSSTPAGRDVPTWAYLSSAVPNSQEPTVLVGGVGVVVVVATSPQVKFSLAQSA